jgi:hypothetical protein
MHINPKNETPSNGGVRFLLSVVVAIWMVPCSYGAGGKEQCLVEFTQLSEATTKPLDRYTSGTFYFHNGYNDPTLEPVVGRDGDIAFIGVVGGVPSDKVTQYAATRAWITRVVKVPPNAPTAIKCSFTTRVTPNKSLDGAGAEDKKMEPTLTLAFARGNFIGRVNTITLNPDGKWQKQEVVLKVPAGAQYLVLKLQADAGDELDLGNWTIE